MKTNHKKVVNLLHAAKYVFKIFPFLSVSPRSPAERFCQDKEVKQEASPIADIYIHKESRYICMYSQGKSSKLNTLNKCGFQVCFVLYTIMGTKDTDVRCMVAT